MPAGVGYEPTPCRIASQAFTALRPEIARPLSHGLSWFILSCCIFVYDDLYFVDLVVIDLVLC